MPTIETKQWFIVLKCFTYLSDKEAMRFQGLDHHLFLSLTARRPFTVGSALFIIELSADQNLVLNITSLTCTSTATSSRPRTNFAMPVYDNLPRGQIYYRFFVELHRDAAAMRRHLYGKLSPIRTDQTDHEVHTIAGKPSSDAH